MTFGPTFDSHRVSGDQVHDQTYEFRKRTEAAHEGDRQVYREWVRYVLRPPRFRAPECSAIARFGQGMPWRVRTSAGSVSSHTGPGGRHEQVPCWSV
jgi:hypothetical protein